MDRILITGGAGFIGLNLVERLLKTDNIVGVVDKGTYASNMKRIQDIHQISNKFVVYNDDICDKVAMEYIFMYFRPTKVIHLAAESHVDNSISSPNSFIQTNVVGTYTLLEVCKDYYNKMEDKEKFRFLHVSTDEVFGQLSDDKTLFNEITRYAPNSPYSASKASSDHLVRAWHKTYGMPTLITNCTNNYGKYQHTEKFIPKIIMNALANKAISVYGSGKQIRDWIHVEDHVEALLTVLYNGYIGNTYLIGASNEQTNINIARYICGVLDAIYPKEIGSYSSQITYVEDRLGHDYRYGVNASKIKTQLGWKPKVKFNDGIIKTVNYYKKEFKNV